MLVPLSWLKEHLETEASVDDICDMLTQLGHEIEEVEDTSPSFDGIVIGHVLEREQHPEADRLGVCKVDIGDGEPKQIVCGAPNARAGIKVAVITVGARLPDGTKIKKSKLRGVESQGMICSERELELSDEHDGILELETDLALGTPFAETQGDGDVVIDVDVTPNRGDCLSIQGIARDLAAAGLGTLKPLSFPEAGNTQSQIKCETKSENCMFFSGIEIRGIKNAESPTWMKQKIEAAGLRPRSAVVDISNYIMLAMGKPIHTYDADKVKGNICAVDAKGGETYMGIGDTEVTFNAEDVMIMDDNGVIGAGGILGGESTAVDDNTTNVYIESAWFDRSRIAKTGQAHQLLTDARYRFERGIDPAETAEAGRWAAQLIQEICGGEVSAQQAVGSNKKDLPTITFDPAFVKTFGGLDIPTSEVKSILEALQFNVSENGGNLDVTPPSFRTFMQNPEDLVEEILRVKGYDAVPNVVMPLPMERQEIAAPTLRPDRTARRHLAGLGYLETITYSFVSEDLANAFAEGQDIRELEHPIDEATMSHMRPSLLPGLLDAADKNLARSENLTRLAEVGKTFVGRTETLCAAGIQLPSTQRHWQGKNSDVDAFSAKADALNILETLGVATTRMQITDEAPSYYHPGRSGSLRLGNNVFGTFGEIHPAILKKFDLKGPIVGFELNLEVAAKIKSKTKAFKPSNYQPVERDLAFIVDENVAAGDLLNTIRNTTKDLGKSFDLFDVYTGTGVPEGKKSLAITMTLQANDRTLTDDEINKVVKQAVEAAEKHYQAELRD